MIITDQNTLGVLLTGTTHYLRVSPEAEFAIFYETAETARMALPDGNRRSGVWRLTPTGYHVDWTGGPSANWQIDVEPGHIVYRDGDGVERGTVTRIVPGDAAALAA
jgi:hypothetical protein